MLREAIKILAEAEIEQVREIQPWQFIQIRDWPDSARTIPNADLIEGVR